MVLRFHPRHGKCARCDVYGIRLRSVRGPEQWTGSAHFTQQSRWQEPIKALRCSLFPWDRGTRSSCNPRSVLVVFKAKRRSRKPRVCCDALRVHIETRSPNPGFGHRSKSRFLRRDLRRSLSLRRSPLTCIKVIRSPRTYLWITSGESRDPIGTAQSSRESLPQADL